MADQSSGAESPLSHGERDGLDTLFSALASKHRRNVLGYFQQSGDDVTTVDSLVEYAATQEGVRGDRERLAIQFHHLTLPHLEAAGLVEYDARSNTVRYRKKRVSERLLEVFTEVEVVT